MQITIALLITIASACALNVGYLIEHSVVSQLPPLTLRHPLRSLRSILAQRRWLLGFSIEVTGWLLYVVALALAPLSLVQATAAGGIGILAVMVSRWTGVALTRLERLGVVVSILGLALLGVSLAGVHGEGEPGDYLAIVLWLAASALAAGLMMRFGVRLVGPGAAFGVATGLLFAAGDVATKSAVSGGTRLAFIAALIACYGAGTAVLQAGFQRGSALVTAGVATLFTNALPIAAGMTIFAEPLPGGALGAIRIAAFAMVIFGAVALARHQKGAGAAAEEQHTAAAAAAPVGT